MDSIKEKTTTGTDLSSKQMADAGSVKGKSFLPEVTKLIPPGTASVGLQCPKCGAVANHLAATWPTVNTDGFFVLSPIVTFGITCNVCSCDFVFKPSDQIEQTKEQERLQLNRAYFEVGCSCIHSTKTLQPCPTNMADEEAVLFYEQNCKCSRNYIRS